MATDIVDDGSAANDGNGDTLRAAFTAINTHLQKADATSGSALILFEDTTSGTNTITMTSGTTAIAANRTITVPDADVNLGVINTIQTTTNGEGASLIGLEDAATLYTATDVEAALAEIGLITTTANGEGASLIGVEDAGTLFTATNVEAALAEAKALVDTNTTHVTGDGSDHADVATNSAFVTALGSVANGAGASTVAIEDAATLFTATDVEAALAEAATDIVALQGQTTALIAENTDGQLFVPASEMVAVSGTWTLSESSNLAIQTRTAAAAAHKVIFPVDLRGRTTASKGAKITSIELVYQNTVEVADDIAPALIVTTLGGTGVAPTAAAAAITFATATDSAAKRGAIAELTAVATVDTPAYIADNKGYHVSVTVDDTTGGGAVVILKGLLVNFSETLVDGS